MILGAALVVEGAELRYGAACALRAWLVYTRERAGYLSPAEQQLLADCETLIAARQPFTSALVRPPSTNETMPAMNSKSAASMLGISERSVRDMAARGRLSARRHGSRWPLSDDAVALEATRRGLE